MFHQPQQYLQANMTHQEIAREALRIATAGVTRYDLIERLANALHKLIHAVDDEIDNYGVIDEAAYEAKMLLIEIDKPFISNKFTD